MTGTAAEAGVALRATPRTITTIWLSRCLPTREYLVRKQALVKSAWARRPYLDMA
jgi:hypothetical protein